MHPKHPLYKIHVISPLSNKDQQRTETKTSYKITQFEQSISTKFSKFNYEYKQRRPVSLSFNLGKIMPKTISHDKQTLYEENLNLKENLKYLNNQIAKLKTRVNISEHEAQKIIQATYSDISKSNSNLSLTKNDKTSEPQKSGGSKISWMWLQSQGLLKKQLIKTREQNARLKQSNEKLRKSLKYTQIQELTIQNKHLNQQCARLKKLLESYTSESSKESVLLSADLKTTKEDLAKQKQHNTFISFQLRSKVREIDLLRHELSKVKQRETKLETQFNSLKAKIKVLTEETQLLRKKKVEKQDQNTLQAPKNIEKMPNEDQQQIQKIKNTLIEDNQKQMLKNPEINVFKQIQDQNSIIYHHKNRVIQLMPQSPKKEMELPKQQKKKQIQQKLNQLKETLTYRFKSQRYTFQNLKDDLMNTNLSFLTVEQLNGLFSSQPFFLENQQLQQVLSFMFGTEKKPSKIEIKELILKLKNFIDDFELIDEEKEEEFLGKWKKIFKPISSTLIQNVKERGIMTKSQFRQFIVNIQVPNEEIQILLAEASIVSNSINKINVPAFVLKMLKY